MFFSQSSYEAQHSGTKSISQFQYILKTIRHNTIQNVLKIVAFMPVQVASRFCSEEGGTNIDDSENIIYKVCSRSFKVMRKYNVSLNKPIDLMFLLVSPSCHLKRSNIYGWGEGEGVE